MTIEDAPVVHDPRREAGERLGPGFCGLVLEPSPPAVVDGTWFADDPLEPPTDRAGVELVWPLGGDALDDSGGAGTTWMKRALADDTLAGWAAARWLGPFHRLDALPASYEQTRHALHQVGVHVVSPARRTANGKIAMRYTHRGFGSPFFERDGASAQVRVEHGLLVVQEGDEVRYDGITTLEQAAALVGVEVDHEATSHVGGDAPPIDEGALHVDEEAADALGAWYGFTCSVLEELRATARRDADGSVPPPSRLQIWPEHFDLAFDFGNPDTGGRANFGGSPGDAGIPEPYLYVGPFDREGLDDPYWNAPFGATLRYADLVRAVDQRAAALSFLREGRDRLATHRH